MRQVLIARRRGWRQEAGGEDQEPAVTAPDRNWSIPRQRSSLTPVTPSLLSPNPWLCDVTTRAPCNHYFDISFAAAGLLLLPRVL